jgi:hypothetical protein
MNRPTKPRRNAPRNANLAMVLMACIAATLTSNGVHIGRIIRRHGARVGQGLAVVHRGLQAVVRIILGRQMRRARRGEAKVHYPLLAGRG